MKKFLVLCLSIVMALSLVACDWESGWEQPDWPSEYEEDVNREDPEVTNPSNDEMLSLTTMKMCTYLISQLNQMRYL